LAVAVDEEVAVVVLVVPVCNKQRTSIYHAYIQYIVNHSLNPLKKVILEK